MKCGQEDNYKWQVTLACFHIKLINRPNIRAFNRQRRARCWECVDERKFLEKTIEYNLNLINENIYEPKNLKNNYLYLLTEEWEEMYIEKKFNKFVWGDGTLLPKIAEILIKRHAFLERNSSYV